MSKRLAAPTSYGTFSRGEALGFIPKMTGSGARCKQISHLRATEKFNATEDKRPLEQREIHRGDTKSQISCWR